MTKVFSVCPLELDGQLMDAALKKYTKLFNKGYLFGLFDEKAVVNERSSAPLECYRITYGHKFSIDQ